MSNEGPLKDVRVIELGQLIAGPFCGQLLGDFGAQVIKVEAPKLSATAGSIRWPSPELGEHNDEVYRGLLGLDPDRIEKLADAGII